MMLTDKQVMDINQFFVTGINYKKTDASVRGQFAIQSHQYASLLEKAKEQGLQELFVLSTCNRTEVYGIAPGAADLAELLCRETTGSIETFKQLCYVKKGVAAVEHLFSVAAGLDSQILGDYEIVGQLKQAVKFAKEKGFVGTFLERLINVVLQSSKIIKNQTALSGGTVSVAFAAIQFLKENVKNISNKKIVLLGTGKIGCNTCKNLVDYLDTTNITLINRTEDKAVELAKDLDLHFSCYDNLNEEVSAADVVIVATNAEQPVINKADLINSNKKILIDLSIPNNIDPAAKELAHITLINVDELSKLNDKTLQKRLAEVPKAKAIINEYICEFIEWYNMRKHVPVLKAVKQKLIDMHQCNLFMSLHQDVKECPYSNPDAIQKVINNMAIKMRDRHQPGCNYIEAINDFIAGRAN
ncbi:MAG: glutamyl-tRNA reductase [Ilyomonas sp.]